MTFRAALPLGPTRFQARLHSDFGVHRRSRYGAAAQLN